MTGQYILYRAVCLLTVSHSVAKVVLTISNGVQRLTVQTVAKKIHDRSIFLNLMRYQLFRF